MKKISLQKNKGTDMQHVILYQIKMQNSRSQINYCITLQWVLVIGLPPQKEVVGQINGPKIA